MKHEVTIRLVKKQGFFTETFLIDAKNGDQAAAAGDHIAASLFDKDKEIISYSIIGIHPAAALEKASALSPKAEPLPGKKAAKTRKKRKEA